MSLKKQAILLLLICFSTSASFAGSEKFSWSKVIDAIVKVESNGNHKAKNGYCVGPMQISPIMVKQCNEILKEKDLKPKYKLADRYDLSKSKEMFYLFQKKYNPEMNIEKAIRSWNGGPNFNHKFTNSYYKKVIYNIK